MVRNKRDIHSILIGLAIAQVIVLIVGFALIIRGTDVAVKPNYAPIASISDDANVLIVVPNLDDGYSFVYGGNPLTVDGGNLVIVPEDDGGARFYVGGLVTEFEITEYAGGNAERDCKNDHYPRCFLDNIVAGGSGVCDCGYYPPPECRDGIDNDGDGRIDYPDDFHCVSPEDPTEAYVP